MSAPLIFTDLFSIVANQEQVPWQAFRPGIEIHRLYATDSTGASAALLRYEPGASVPSHDHLGFEHIFILSGSQVDHQGEHHSGTLVINPPGSTHTVHSPNGCIVLVIWEKPVVIREEI